MKSAGHEINSRLRPGKLVCVHGHPVVPTTWGIVVSAGQQRYLTDIHTGRFKVSNHLSARIGRGATQNVGQAVAIADHRIDVDSLILGSKPERRSLPSQSVRWRRGSCRSSLVRTVSSTTTMPQRASKYGRAHGLHIAPSDSWSRTRTDHRRNDRRGCRPGDRRNRRSRLET